jgi:hypothetical protein
VDFSDSRQHRLIGVQVIRIIASRSLRDWGFALVAVLASLLLSPRACEATCGDYLHADGHFAAMARSLPNQPMSPDGSSDNLADPSVPHRQCQGPGCSGRSFPPQAPDAGVVDSIERWALATTNLVPNIVCSDQLLAEPNDLVVDGFRLSILRPPR